MVFVDFEWNETCFFPTAALGHAGVVSVDRRGHYVCEVLFLVA